MRRRAYLPIQTNEAGQSVRSSPGYMLNCVVHNIERRHRANKLEPQTFSFEESKEYSDSFTQHDRSMFSNFKHAQTDLPACRYPSTLPTPMNQRSSSSLYMRIQNLSPSRVSRLRFVQPRVRLRRQLLSHPRQKHILSLFAHIRGLKGSFSIAVLD